MACEDWDVASIESGAIVRDATDRAVGQYSGPKTAFGWPPNDYQMEISLRGREWARLLEQMEHWAPYSELELAAMKKPVLDALGEPPYPSDW